jgi:hypothetical protein
MVYIVIVSVRNSTPEVACVRNWKPDLGKHTNLISMACRGGEY